jgi:hypothetical protein
VNEINLQAIAAAGLKIGIDPMAVRASLLGPIAERFTEPDIVNPFRTPTFALDSRS